MSGNTPYSQASEAYGKKSMAAATDQRTMEGHALMKAAMKLEQLSKALRQDPPPSLQEVDQALEYNRKLWTVFAGETINDDHPLPDQIKNNIANLSIFIFKRTIECLADPQPEKLSALININRQIASGLLTRPAGQEDSDQAVEQKPAVSSTDSLA